MRVVENDEDSTIFGAEIENVVEDSIAEEEGHCVKYSCFASYSDPNPNPNILLFVSYSDIQIQK